MVHKIRAKGCGTRCEWEWRSELLLACNKIMVSCVFLLAKTPTKVIVSGLSFDLPDYYLDSDLIQKVKQKKSMIATQQSKNSEVDSWVLPSLAKWYQW